MDEKNNDLAANTDTLMRLVNRYKEQITDLEIQIVKRDALIDSQREVMAALRQEVGNLRGQIDATPMSDKPIDTGNTGDQPAAH